MLWLRYFLAATFQQFGNTKHHYQIDCSLIAALCFNTNCYGVKYGQMAFVSEFFWSNFHWMTSVIEIVCSPSHLFWNKFMDQIAATRSLVFFWLSSLLADKKCFSSTVVIFRYFPLFHFLVSLQEQQWQADKEAVECQQCLNPFTLARRKVSCIRYRCFRELKAVFYSEFFFARGWKSACFFSNLIDQFIFTLARSLFNYLSSPRVFWLCFFSPASKNTPNGKGALGPHDKKRYNRIKVKQTILEFHSRISFCISLDFRKFAKSSKFCTQFTFN